ncbi:MAG: hypothetical protein ABII72_02615 [Parcubacteria group bacterium]
MPETATAGKFMAEQFGNPSDGDERFRTGDTVVETRGDIEARIKDNGARENGEEREGTGFQEKLPREENPVAFIRDCANWQMELVNRANTGIKLLREKLDEKHITIRQREGEDVLQAENRARQEFKDGIKEHSSKRDKALKEAERLNGIASGVEAGNPKIIEIARGEIREEYDRLVDEETGIYGELTDCHNKMGVLEAEGYGEGIEEVTSDTPNDKLTDFGAYVKYTNLRKVRVDENRAENDGKIFYRNGMIDDEEVTKCDRLRSETAYGWADIQRRRIEQRKTKKEAEIGRVERMLKNLDTFKSK